MFRRSSRNIILFVGLLAVSSGLSTYVAADQQASVTVGTALDEHWRGAYDILVRPKDSVQPIEQQYGLVESNYLSAASLGITVQQWKAIEGLPGVEVAAPVSTIGYLRTARGQVGLEVPPQTEPSLYRFTMTITSTNGYRDVQLATYQKYFLIGPPPPSISNATTQEESDQLAKSVNIADITLGSIGPNGAVVARAVTPPPIWALVAGIDPSAESRLTQLDKAIIENTYLRDNDGVLLTKVGGNISNDERKDRQQDTRNSRLNPDGPDVPIIRASNAYATLPTTVVIDRLEMLDAAELDRLREVMHQAYLDANSPGYIPNEETNPRLEAYHQFIDSLHQPVLQNLVTNMFNLGDILKPMSDPPINVSIYPGKAPLQTDPKTWMAQTTGLEKSYQPGGIDYEPHVVTFDTGGMLVLSAIPKVDAQTIISLTGETAFRSLAPSTPAMLQPDWDKGITTHNKSPYTFHEMGTYDLSKLPSSILHPDPLTYVPLGIYTPPLVNLVRDADGKLLPGGPVQVNPTMNPASFIPGPPLAFTNIASACFFRGEACIDAIRVRVGGIDRYTPENVRLVEQVATQIVNTTGLHVDIVAGSSPQKVLVYIPGSPDGRVPPLGYVEEPWTTLGAATALTSGIDGASAFMLGAVGIAGLFYLIGQSLLSTLARRRELALMNAVGWRRKDISLLVLGEASVLGLLSGLCATLLAILISLSLGLSVPLGQALLVGLVVLFLYVVASLGPALWVVRQPVADLLQRGEVAVPVTSRRTPLRSQETAWDKASERASFLGAGLRGLVWFAWHNLSRRRVRALLAASSIAIATTLLMALLAALLALGGTLRVTLLGQFIGLQVQPYHFIMVASALAVGVLAVVDHLAMGVLERRHELALLHAVGWRRRDVRLGVLLEGTLLGLTGGLVGSILSTIVGIVSRNVAILSAWWVMPLALLVVLTLCSLSSMYAVSLAPKHAATRVLQ